MTELPKVSVIIPTHNRADLLPRAVSSVLAQTYQNFELLIVDDGSTDYTQDVIAGFSDSRIRAFRQETNRGQSAARNVGIANACGEYIAFLDDDDEFTPTSLADRVVALESAPPDVALVYGGTDCFDHNTGSLTPDSRSTLRGDVFESALTGQNIAITITMLVRTSVAREVGGFREDLPMGEDPHFVAQIAKKYHIEVTLQTACIRHINHGYTQLTNAGAGYRSGMDRYYRIHIETFKPELEQRPKVFAYVLRRSSVHAMECRSVKYAMLASFKALRLHPLTPANVRHLLRLARVFAFYATPLSRYRERAKGVRRALLARRR